MSFEWVLMALCLGHNEHRTMHLAVFYGICVQYKSDSNQDQIYSFGLMITLFALNIRVVAHYVSYITS